MKKLIILAVLAANLFTAQVVNAYGYCNSSTGFASCATTGWDSYYNTFYKNDNNRLAIEIWISTESGDYGVYAYGYAMWSSTGPQSSLYGSIDYSNYEATGGYLRNVALDPDSIAGSILLYTESAGYGSSSSVQAIW